ncbi:HEXXH motif-containing putative peptide modification protein [Nocardia asteroides]|uniref:aKG-HExxH-type peptide beta-hydroxylase n=1 Tax=Nocardia asteroides TaxID=1824 RepID=UPI003421B8E1
MTTTHTEIFHAQPSESRAEILRHRINDMAKTDLIAYCRAAERIFGEHAHNAVTEISRLDTSRQFNPLLYTMHWKLHSGMTANNFGRVSSALGEIQSIADRGLLYSPEFSISNLQWDTLDAEIYDFLAGPEGPRQPNGGLPITRRLDEAHFDTAKRWVEESLPVLRQVDPGMFAEFDRLVAGIRLFDGIAARGITSVRCWGMILLRVPNSGLETEESTLYFLDHITHETSHTVLHSIMTFDPLITNGHGARFTAPIRPDPRPLYGIFHAMFVLSRIAKVLDGYARVEGRASVEQWRDGSIARFYKGYQTIRRHAELTEAGEAVLRSCKESVDAL